MPSSRRKSFKRSRSLVHRAHLKRKKVKEVTASCSIVTTTRGKDERWSRKIVHRAQLEKKKVKEVTQAAPSCPPSKKKKEEEVTQQLLLQHNLSCTSGNTMSIREQ